MRYPRALTTLLPILCLGLAAAAGSGSDPGPNGTPAPPESAEQTARAKPSRFPVFVPPVRGSPRTRVGGATRGPSPEGLPSLEALVPEHVGLTIVSRPVLYWFLSDPTEQRIDFTLINEETPTPLVETTLSGPFAAGVQAIDLARHGVTLERGVVYEWYVALVSDPQRRSSDVIAGGGIQLETASRELRSTLDGAPVDRVPFVLAEHGIWYDAIHDLSRRIDAAPDDAHLRRQRAALMNQVGLAMVAEADVTP